MCHTCMNRSTHTHESCQTGTCHSTHTHAQVTWHTHTHFTWHTHSCHVTHASTHILQSWPACPELPHPKPLALESRHPWVRRHTLVASHLTWYTYSSHGTSQVKWVYVHVHLWHNSAMYHVTHAWVTSHTCSSHAALELCLSHTCMSGVSLAQGVDDSYTDPHMWDTHNSYMCERDITPVWHDSSMCVTHGVENRYTDPQIQCVWHRG